MGPGPWVGFEPWCFGGRCFLVNKRPTKAPFGPVIGDMFTYIYTLYLHVYIMYLYYYIFMYVYVNLFVNLLECDLLI